MKTLRLSEVAILEIIDALEISAKESKKGMCMTFSPFSETVLQHIKEQIQDQPEY